jgi:hypothetical protein
MHPSIQFRNPPEIEQFSSHSPITDQKSPTIHQSQIAIPAMSDVQLPGFFGAVHDETETR